MVVRVGARPFTVQLKRWRGRLPRSPGYFIYRMSAQTEAGLPERPGSAAQHVKQIAWSGVGIHHWPSLRELIEPLDLLLQ